MCEHVLDVHPIVRIYIWHTMPHRVCGVGVSLLHHVRTRCLVLAADTKHHSAGGILDLVLVGVKCGVVDIDDRAHVGRGGWRGWRGGFASAAATGAPS